MKKYAIILFLIASITGGCSAQSTKQVNSSAKISDSALLDLVQKQTFQYFWGGAEPTSGLGRERFHSDNIYPDNDKSTVTSGGAGFGVMSILVAIERKFISRQQGRARLEKIVHFLETADR